ncbi:hypothetical protein FRB91_009597 [Serendipita sp. 411]|nr:hypothetical protein FRB91_009597 [Serendipita sp. 411]KAG9021422.1 hypothetical protein FS842_006608 [Serendipita sp. 407]
MKILLTLLRFMLMGPDEYAQVMWWKIWTSTSPWSTGKHQTNQREEEVVHNHHVTKEVRKTI